MLPTNTDPRVHEILGAEVASMKASHHACDGMTGEL